MKRKAAKKRRCSKHEERIYYERQQQAAIKEVTNHITSEGLLDDWLPKHHRRHEKEPTLPMEIVMQIYNPTGEVWDDWYKYDHDGES